MASGNSLRPWGLTKGKRGPRPRAPSPGLDLGTFGQVLDWAGLYLPFLPTSDEIEFQYEKLTHTGIFAPVREPTPKKRPK